MDIRSPFCEICGQRGGDVPLYHDDGTIDLFHRECAIRKMTKERDAN